MDDFSAALVTTSSFLHLGWNTAMRSTAGSLRFVWYLLLGGGIFAAAGTVLAGIAWNFSTIWPWVLATIAIHSLYFASLAMSYRQGALSRVYPAARGGGILFSLPLAFALFHQIPGLWATAGACLIAVAVLIPALPSASSATKETRRSLWWVLSVAVLISLYSAVDSHSVHLISPWPYLSAQYLGAAAILAPWALRTQDHTPLMPGLLSGVVSAVSYLLVLYAYQHAALGPVLALRQVAIGVAPLAAWLFLKERWRKTSIMTSLAILLGCVMILSP